jgi:hypothetical protein
VTLWVAEGAKSAADIGGFALALRLGKSEVAVIPIAGDRPVPGRIKLAPGYRLTPIAPAP